MHSIIQQIIVILISLALFGSCKKDIDSAVSQKPQITFQQNPFEVAVGVYGRLEPKGGNNYYVIKQIDDSTIVEGYNGGEYIFLRGKKLGQTSVLVEDGAGLINSVSVIVKSLVVRRLSLKMWMGAGGTIEIESLHRNYSVTSHDTTIVKPVGYTNDGTNSYVLWGRKMGTTSVDVLDSNTMVVKNIPVEVVEPPAAELHFASNLFTFDAKNGNTDTNFVYGYFQVWNDRHFVDELRVNAVKSYADGSEQLFIISLDVDSLYQGLVVDVPDSLSTRFTLIYGDSKRDTGSYWSHKAHIEITTLTASRIAGVFSGTAYFSTGSGEGTKYYLSDSLVISNGSFNAFNVDSLYNGNFFAKIKTPLERSAIFPNR